MTNGIDYRFAQGCLRQFQDFLSAGAFVGDFPAQLEMFTQEDQRVLNIFQNAATEFLFDDRVEIHNPGGLPKGLKPEDFGTRSVCRNPLIANLLLRCDYIERLGTGIKRIRTALKNADCPDVIPRFTGFFTLEFPRPTYGTPVETRVKAPVKIPELILKHLKSNPQMTLAELAQQINKSLSAVERASTKLVKQGKLVRVGPKKGGHWEVNDER